MVINVCPTIRPVYLWQGRLRAAKLRWFVFESGRVGQNLTAEGAPEDRAPFK